MFLHSAAYGVNFTAFPLTADRLIIYPPLTLGGVTASFANGNYQRSERRVAAPTGPRDSLRRRWTNIIVAAAKPRPAPRRAGIRLPVGQAAQVFYFSVVNNPNLDGSAAGNSRRSFCTSPDTTRFSWDVSVQKARTALFFLRHSLRFLRAHGWVPRGRAYIRPAIGGTQPGLFFGLQERFSSYAHLVVATNSVNGAVFTTSSNVNPNLPTMDSILSSPAPFSVLSQTAR